LIVTLSDLEQALADAPPPSRHASSRRADNAVAIVLPPLAGTARAQSEAAAADRKARVASRHGDRSGQGADHLVEIPQLTMPALRGLRGKRFPMLQSKYHRHRKGALVSREFPLDIKAAAASMLARCAANGDAPKYFKPPPCSSSSRALMVRTTETLKAVGDRFDMNEQPWKPCVKDQALLDKLTADRNLPSTSWKVDATPTFFINGERLRGAHGLRRTGQEARSPSEALRRFNRVPASALQRTSIRSGSSESRQPRISWTGCPWP